MSGRRCAARRAAGGRWSGSDRCRSIPRPAPPPATGSSWAWTAREFDLLEALARRAGDVVSRDWPLEQAWDVAYEQRSNVVDAYVRLLRAKLDRPFDRPMLHTVRGSGYRLQAPG